MKKYFIYLASAAMLLATSCAKEEVNTTGETELITVQLNPETKTALGAEGTTTWDADDKVSVTVGGEVVGILSLVEGSTFSGEITAGLSGDATLKYPADVTAIPEPQAAVNGSFADGAALLEGTTTVEKLRAGEGVELQNKTALLQFQTPVAGDVAFTIGSTTYTVTGCETGKTYYACVAPATGKLSYTVGLALGAKEKTDFAPVANQVYALGTLELKKSMYGIAGTYSNDDWKTDTYLYETAQDNFFVYYGITFNATAEFKVRKAGGWVDDYNFGTTTTAIKAANSVVGVYTDGGSQNIKVNAGIYDIYFDRLAGQVYIMDSGKSHTTVAQPTTTSYYSLAGNFAGGGWDDTVAMKYSGDGIWTNVQTFAVNNEFKVKNKGNWDASWGYDNVYPGQGLVSNSNGNAKLKAAGTYIVGFYKTGNKITLVKK